jgi:hypothetical protein
MTTSQIEAGHTRYNGHEYGQNCARYGNSERNCFFPTSHRERLARAPILSNTVDLLI